jgi:hypothetical protein
MNVSGSILANYWRKRPVAPVESSVEPQHERGFDVVPSAPAPADAVRTA